MSVQKVTLNNGVEMPQEGFGVFQINGFDNCRKAVKDAISVGYRAIDTAQAYKNEEAVGQGIQESEVDRSDIFITTKVDVPNFGYERAKQSILGSLKKLQTDYLDLVIFHDPYGDYYGAYRAMEELYRKGYLRAIGVSNLPTDRYLDLANFSDVVPALNQVESHVFNQRKEMHKYLAKYGTYVEAWSPLAEGKNNLFQNETLKRIGDKYHKTPAQVALRFLIQNNVIIIPKSTHVERMEENLNIWDFELSDNDISMIEKLDQDKDLFVDHSDPVMTEKFINSLK